MCFILKDGEVADWQLGLVQVIASPQAGQIPQSKAVIVLKCREEKNGDKKTWGGVDVG